MNPETDTDNPETDTDNPAKRADERDAAAAHQADRPPTPAEEHAAEENELDPKTAEAYEEMAKLGAHVKGEGQID